MAPVKTITVDDVRAIVQARVAEAESVRQAAKALKVSATSILDVLRGAYPPGPRLLKALGYRRVELYTRLAKAKE